MVTVADQVRAPVQPGPDRVRDAFFESVRKITFGLVTARPWSLWLGPILMLKFSPPRANAGGWSWEIESGLLAAEPGGRLAYEWKDGVLYGRVEDYRPRIPGLLFRVTQLPFHHLVTRLFLLGLRGRVPTAGVPAEPALKLLAGTADILVCTAIAGSLGRRRFLAALVPVLVAYHVGSWAGVGQTPAGRLIGQRLVAVDGSRVTPGQAALRLITLPAAVLRLRALHDEAAGTEVIRT